MKFPETLPQRSSFPRPFAAEVLDVSPPGFCWPRAGELGACAYRLRIDGPTRYESALLVDPVCVPETVLAAGDYTWQVDALVDGRVTDTWPGGRFSLTPTAVAQPWTPAEELLARVPASHPRLLFTADGLDAVRATLTTTRSGPFAALRQLADEALDLTPPPEPDYHLIEDPAVRRLEYVRQFQEYRRYHTAGMVNLALMYLLSGERQYGEVAKAILLGAAEWDPDQVSRVQGYHGDEIGLGLAKSEAQAYDWLWDLLTEEERVKAAAMVRARGEQCLDQLQNRSDYLACPAGSHDGRLPGYLAEHAIALAEEPRSAVWLDYALRALMTVFPHWGGPDGGWAEGMSYGLAYNTIYLCPFESIRVATGLDLWQRPFYRKVRHFFAHNLSPVGEHLPWGDMENTTIPPRAAGIRALLQFHALRYRDAELRGWVELLRDEHGELPAPHPLPGILLADDLPPADPATLPPDRIWHDVGWATMHSELAVPERDVMVMFKSSPYGAVSHSHADQNSFAILAGGKGLAIPAGERYPHHGSPFHTDYVQQTISHNALLIDGQGQVNRDARRGGRLVRFESQPGWALVSGDASRCYDGVDQALRHLLFVRPGLICLVDDLTAPAPVAVDWLFHTPEAMALDPTHDRFVVRRDHWRMAVELFTPGGVELGQTDDWAVPPKQGYPTATRPEPEPQWHLMARCREQSTSRRIVAVMAVGDLLVTTRHHAGEVAVEASGDGWQASLQASLTGEGPALRLVYQGDDGAEQTIVV